MSQHPAGQRSRFQLAARWFRRRQEASNLIDRLLFWWLALEVCVGHSTRMVGHISHLLKERFYPALEASEFKSRLDLDRLSGKRTAIVHQGKAFVAPHEEA